MMTSAIDKLIALAEEHDAKATKGPVEKRLRDDGLWLVKYPTQPRGFHGDCYGHLTYADSNDVDFFIASRTAWPATARALKVAMEALDKINKCFYATQLPDGQRAEAYYNAMSEKRITACQALAEIDRIAKELDNGK